MPDNTNYHAFDEKALNEAIASVQTLGEAHGFAEAGGQPLANLAESGEMFLAAQCISVTVNNHQVCLNLPKPISKSICLPIPKFIPNGAKLEACIGICYIWKIPSGVKVTVSFNGKVIVQKSWGKC
jgi:hypothetical protein